MDHHHRGRSRCRYHAPMDKLVLDLLRQALLKNPTMTLGQLIEKAEDVAWDIYEKEKGVRYFSRRLMNLPDVYLGKALVDLLTSD